jgi:uncharacterized protein
MKTSLLKSLSAAAVVLTALAACHSPPTRLFTLYPVAPGAPRSAYAGAPIRVDAVHVPPALDRVEVISDIAPGELGLHDLDHWSAPLGQVSRQALSADLIARLPSGSVIFPHLAKPDGALGLVVDILDFKADRAGATLEASWTLARAEDGGAPTRGTAQLHTDQAAEGAAAMARALSTLLAQLADHIVAALPAPGAT